MSRRGLGRIWPAPAARARTLLDGAWIVAFLVLLALLLLRSSASSVDANLMLELRPGIQRQALTQAGKRLGTVLTRTERLARGWQITTTFQIAGGQAALSQLTLRRDLSLAGFALEADLRRLGPTAR